MPVPLRCGLVGVGRISARHREALAHHRAQLELVAVCDTEKQACSGLSDSVQCFHDLGTMLREAKLDIVTVCTPSGLHPEHGIQIAKSGCHVIVEKPMATQWEEGVRLYETCQQQKVKLFVVLQNRYNPTIVKLKQAIAQGRFGKIYMMTSNVFWTRPQSYYDQASWRGTRKLDGGAFMNQASHYVDMLYYLGGEVESVQSATATLARSIECEDTGIALLRYRSGALASLNVTMLTYPKNREGSFTILGEKGYVRIGGTALNTIEAWEFADKQPGDDEATTASYATDSVYGNGHIPFYSDVIESLQQESKPVVDGQQGLKSLELLIAIYDAAKQQRPVSLPLPQQREAA